MSLVVGAGRGTSRSSPNNHRNRNNRRSRHRTGTQRQLRRQQHNVTHAWIRAMEQAVAIVSTAAPSRRGGRSGGSNGESNPHQEQAEASLRYLQQLETILLAEQDKQQQRRSSQQEGNGGGGILQQPMQPPKRPPPPFVATTTNGSNHNTNVGGGVVPSNYGSSAPYWNTATTPPLAASQGPMWMTPTPVPYHNDTAMMMTGSSSSLNGTTYPSVSYNNTNNGNFRNSFAAFGYEDDEEDDSSHDEQILAVVESHPQANSEDEAAGDTPVYHNSILNESTSLTIMSLERLLVRVWTSQADVAAMLSRIDRYNRQYELAVQYCTLAVSKLQPSLVLADQAVSQWWNMTTSQSQSGNTRHTLLLYDALVEDCNAISIALDHVVKERNEFQSWMHREALKLQRKLQPQWSSRDEIRQRWGDERWNNNPNPKHDFAALRQDDELALKHVQQAQAQLNELQVELLQSNCVTLKERLVYANGGAGAGTTGVNGSSTSTSSSEHRYNGIRPNLQQQHRVSWQEYPDPTEFGWAFTGSSEQSRVEFFERLLAPDDSPSMDRTMTDANLVLLDWYYTTGTIKTSLQHPRQGRTQLLGSGSQVTPELYRQILENPRYHTNVRYRHRPNSRGGRSGGRAGRRGRGRGS